MIDPAVKSALALCVLLSGVCAAMLFRSERPRPAFAGPPPTAEIRSQAIVSSTVNVSISQEPSPVIQSATIVAPSERREPPPSLSPEYPETTRPTGSHWNMPMEMMLPVAKLSHTTTHVVVDGDTLPALAQRYLGSSARAKEIFEANRDVLRDPALLPIGVELKLPPRSR